MFEHIPLTLAQDDAPGAPGGDATAAPPPATGGGNEATDGTGQNDQTLDNTRDTPGMLQQMFPLLMVMVVVMIFFSMRGSSKEKKKRAQMISALKKGDKVQTVGGIMGTVLQVNDGEVVLKVDENTGAKISFSRSAVQNVVAEKED